jgi:hypothetical protein
MTAQRKHELQRRYWHATGVVRWIGAHAAVTQYHPEPARKARWQAAVRFWNRVRRDVWAQLHPRPLSVPQIICAVFGAECGKALAVARCESRFYVGAWNGQFFGVFQMGSAERARFGGSSLDPWDQVRAAYRYYRLAGWSPWECA